MQKKLKIQACKKIKNPGMYSNFQTINTVQVHLEDHLFNVFKVRGCEICHSDHNCFAIQFYRSTR